MDNHDVLQLVREQLLDRLTKDVAVGHKDILRLSNMGVNLLVDDMVERSLELLRKREEI